MVLLEDVPRSEHKVITGHEAPTFDTRPWVEPRPLATRTVALINSAGLMLRGERPVVPGTTGYRTIPSDVDANEVLMSHVSVNFDRVGFQGDYESVVPRQVMRDLVNEGVIAGLSRDTYSFMGATNAQKMEGDARRLAGELRDQGVDAALLLPV